MCIVFNVHCSDCCSHALSWTQPPPWGLFIGMEKCQTQDIQSEVGNSQAPWGDFIAVEKCWTHGISGSVAMCRHRKMLDPGHSIGSGWLPGSLRTVLEWKNVGPRGIESEVADSQLLRCLYFPASLGQLHMTHEFSFRLCLLSSQKMH